MKTLLRVPTLWLASALTLLFAPTSAEAQKALVYCPAIDQSGCTAVRSALLSAYPGGVDTGDDGSNGTVDLRTVDLFQYAVFFVPSLAETDSAAPYALLRDAAVAGRLKTALLGRRAFWSGTPDQGALATTRPAKDALIQNLAAWAGADFGSVNAPGLVVLQDNSDVVTQRYSWVQPIVGFQIIADPKLASYNTVRSLTAAGNAILSANGSTLAFGNMASFGFQTPSGASGLSMDAVGQTGTSVGGQVVLVTQVGANTGGAVITTDTDDYPPFTPVIITGSGFQSGEAVSLTFHEDPFLHPDRVHSATADGSGRFVYSGFAPDSHDVDVRFVLTAKGQSSGRQAQTTFTDGQPTGIALTQSSVSVLPGNSAVYTVNVTVGGNGANCSMTLSSTAVATGVVASFTPSATISTNASFSRTLTLTTTNSGPPASRTPSGNYNFTVSVTPSSCQGNNNPMSTNGTLVVLAPTSLVLGAPSPATVSPGSTGPVSISATLTAASGPVNGGVVAFTVDGNAIGTATTNASGVATIANYNPSALAVGPHSLQATFAQKAIGAVTYDASSSGTQTLTVGKSNQTISFGTILTKTFGDADFALTATATSGLTVTFAASGNCTIVSGNTARITGAGSCTITASQAGNTTYNAATDVVQTFTIDKAVATVAIDAPSLAATYDGAAHPVTVTTNPVGLATIAVTYDGNSTAPTNAGTYAVVAKLTNANYTATDATGSLVIAPATPVFTNLSAPPVTYKAGSATISGTVKAGALAAAGPVSVTVAGPGGALNASASVDATTGNFSAIIDPSTLPATSTGYDIAVSTPLSPNFLAASNNSLKLVVNKASQTISFDALGAKTFGDASFDVSASASSGLPVTFVAGGPCSITGVAVTITGAGNCTITAKQVGDGNYNPATDAPQSFTIAKAKATITVNGVSTVYDGSAHGATGSASGVGGADLSGSLNFGQKFTSVPGGTANWTFTGGANYLDDAGTAAIVITQATGSIGISGPATLTFGQSSPITTTKTGDGSVSYAATAGGESVCTVDATTGAVSMISGTGNCKVQASLTAGQNYTGATSAEITIAAAKANATIVVNGYSGAYDGAAHGATGSAKGIDGLALPGLNLGASYTDVPGGPANWTFTGGTNYNDANGSVQITISKANQTTAVALTAPASMTYGQASVTLTATGGDGTGAYAFSLGSSTGCSLNGDKLSVSNASGTCAVTAVRLGDNNYFDSAPTAAATVMLVKANATVTVNGFSGPYDGLPHGASGTAVGVNGDDLSSGFDFGSTFTSVPGGTANWTFAGGNNYNSTSGTATITISQKAASVTPAAATKVYGENDPPLTGTLSGFIGSDGVTALYSRTSGENVSGSPYTISAVLSPSGVLGNYNVTYGTANFTITPATPTVSVTGATFPYDGTDHPATGSVAGVNGEVPGSPVFTYSKNGGGFSTTQPNGAGTYAVKANFAGGGNYGPAVEQTATITITQLPVTATITASGKPYDGNTSVVGPVGCSVSGVIAADVGTTGCSASGASFGDANAGPQTVSATVALTGTSADNYLLSPTTATVAATITPAVTVTTVTVSGATYDALAHGGTALTTGPAGLSVNPAITYTGVGSTSYGPSTTAPTNAGSYTAAASYVATNNYQASSDTKTFTIAKRDISIQPSVTNASALVWTGSPLTPTYQLNAVNGTSLGSGETMSVLGSPTILPTTVTPVGSFTITVSGLSNPNYNITPVAGTGVVLDQSSPSGTITQLNPVALNTPATLNVNFSDLASGSSNIVKWRYQLDQGPWSADLGLIGAPSANANGTASLPGSAITDVIKVCVQGQDAGGNWSAPVCGLLAVYDPSTGFVTGGGWIDSPAGAYVAQPLLTGKANFGFVSKYQKGATSPSGNTEFQFQEGNLNFKSTNFSWLVIQGTTMAQFKGTGTINGTGNYQFLVTALDGDNFVGTRKGDAFRIKITNGSTVVYDNQITSDETSSAATALGGGSIQIQTK